MQPDVDVLVIGAGMSGLGLAIQLIRKYGTRNFELIEKTGDIGGTWWVNSYPGCGCDVASHFYSYSFAPKFDWSEKFALQPEILEYFRELATRYRIPEHVRFGSVVEDSHWDDASGTWSVNIRDLSTGEIRRRTCKILVSAVGALSIPKKCEIPGAPSFKGKLFHSAEWDHSFDWKDKDVVVIGNGCSATQFVPILSSGKGAAHRVTQFSRQAHWLMERPNPKYSPLFKWAMKWLPLAMRIYRFKLYLEKELEFKAFDIKSGVEMRRGWMENTAKYIRSNAPEKYKDFLVPKTEIGCKRRVNDTDYLKCLHRDNVELVYDDPVEEIVEEGVRTRSGRVIHADAIALANGFETHKFLAPIKIHGIDGSTVNDHWSKVSENVSSAYFGTCVSGFPNFFIMMGPNTLTGHLSVIFTSECQINYILRVIRPILKSQNNKRSVLPALCTSPDIIDVTPEAEAKDINAAQEKLKKLVWASGCVTWTIEPKTQRNTGMFPDYQYIYWLRSIFVKWSDFQLRVSSDEAAAKKEKGYGGSLAVGSLGALAVGLGAFLVHKHGIKL